MPLILPPAFGNRSDSERCFAASIFDHPHIYSGQHPPQWQMVCRRGDDWGLARSVAFSKNRQKGNVSHVVSPQNPSGFSYGFSQANARFLIWFPPSQCNVSYMVSIEQKQRFPHVFQGMGRGAWMGSLKRLRDYVFLRMLVYLVTCDPG